MKSSTIARRTKTEVSRRPATGEVVWDGERWRRWGGESWAAAAYSLDPARLSRPEPLHRDPELDLERRRFALERAVEDQVLNNEATLLHQGGTRAVLQYRSRVVHGGHLALTILTGGLWGAVWAYCVLTARKQRYQLEVDPWGHVWPRKGGLG